MMLIVIIRMLNDKDQETSIKEQLIIINMEENALKDLIERTEQLAHNVYNLTYKFPKEEIYCLTQQLRRSIISVPSNIIEGYARQKSKVYINHLEIAYASLAESKFYLRFAFKREYINEDEYKYVYQEADQVSRILWVIIEKIRFKTN